MASSTSGDSSDELRRYIDIETRKSIWRASLLEGQELLVQAMLKDGFTPDHPVEDGGCAPLAALAGVRPRNSRHGDELVETALLLVHSGATLSLPDYRNLLPADHAMVGHNPKLAAAVAVSTMRQCFKDNPAAPSYRPNLDCLFASMPDELQRAKAYRRFLVNAAAVRDKVAAAVEGEDPYIVGHRKEDIEYWMNFVPPPRMTLALPPPGLRDRFSSAYKAVQQADFSFPSKQNDETLLAYRFLEWQSARAFTLKPK